MDDQSKKGTEAILSFTATPSTISAGQSSTLAWETQGAHKVILIPEDEVTGVYGRGQDVPPSGTLVVTPPETTRYVLSLVSGPGATAEVIVTVQ